MGVKDTEGKQYLSNTRYFAELFNFLLYDGKPVIKANEIRELDTTELTVPTGIMPECRCSGIETC